MVIAEFFMNHSRCKTATKSMDHQHEHATTSTTRKSSKLSRFFKKITHPALTPHHSDHRHLLKRPSMAQMNPPIFQSDSQIPIIDQCPDSDKDKMYERRRYQQTNKRMAQQRWQQSKDHDYSLQQNEQLATSYSNDNDSNYLIRRRPSLTTSPSFDGIPRRQPSFPSSDRNSTINANIHSDDNSISSNDNSGEDDNRDYIRMGGTRKGNDTKDGNGDDDDSEGDNFENSHGHDSTGSDRILLEQQLPTVDTTHSKNGKPILSIERLSPITTSDDSMMIEHTTHSTQLDRNISAPSQLEQQQQQQHHHVPWILQELRRMNTISNDPSSTQHYHRHQASSLQRNRSYVIRKGRFEISIEPSD